MSWRAHKDITWYQRVHWMYPVLGRIRSNCALRNVFARYSFEFGVWRTSGWNDPIHSACSWRAWISTVDFLAERFSVAVPKSCGSRAGARQRLVYCSSCFQTGCIQIQGPWLSALKGVPLLEKSTFQDGVDPNSWIPVACLYHYRFWHPFFPGSEVATYTLRDNVIYSIGVQARDSFFYFHRQDAPIITFFVVKHHRL